MCVYIHSTRAVLFPACLLTLLLGGRFKEGRRVALETLMWEGKTQRETIKERPDTFSLLL